MPSGNDWNLQTHALSPNEQKIEIFMGKATGHKFPTLSKKFASMFSLYKFLNERQNVDPAILQPHITDDEGKPMFSLNDLKEIQATIRKQTSGPMSDNNARQILEHVKNVYSPLLNARYTAQPTRGGRRNKHSKGSRRYRSHRRHSGGGAPSAISLRDPSAPGYDPSDDVLGGPQRPGFRDTSRDGFFDRIFLKLGNIYENSPIALKFSHKWDGIFWFMYLLYNLENIDLIGPFLSTGLDAYVVGVRMAVDAVHEHVPGILSKVGSILPIGVGGFAGEALGQVIANLAGGFMLIGTVIVSMSRKHFGDAFKQSLEMIPMLGDFLLTFAMSMETNLDRINNYRNKLVHQLENVSPTLFEFVDYWVPKLEPVPPNPPPIPTIAAIKDDIVEMAAAKSGANKALEGVQNAVANPLDAMGQLPPMPTLPTVPGAPTPEGAPPAPAAPAAPAPEAAPGAPAPGAPEPAPGAPAAPAPAAPAPPATPAPTDTATAAAVVAAPNGAKAAFGPTPIKKRGGRRNTRRRTYKRNKGRSTIRRR